MKSDNPCHKWFPLLFLIMMIFTSCTQSENTNKLQITTENKSKQRILLMDSLFQGFVLEDSLPKQNFILKDIYGTEILNINVQVYDNGESLVNMTVSDSKGMLSYYGNMLNGEIYNEVNLSRLNGISFVNGKKLFSFFCETCHQKNQDAIGSSLNLMTTKMKLENFVKAFEKVEEHSEVNMQLDSNYLKSIYLYGEKEDYGNVPKQ